MRLQESRILGLLAATLLLIAGCESPAVPTTGTATRGMSAAGTTPATTATPAPEVEEVDLGDLISDYVMNSIAADQKYRSRVIQIEFPVMRIGRGITGRPFLLYEIRELADFGILGLRASFDRQAEDDVAQLQMGDMATLTCQGGGLQQYIRLLECVVQSVE